MKFAAIALFAAAFGPALAQISSDEQPIMDGFAMIRLQPQIAQNQPEIFLQLSGTDQFGSRTNNLYSKAWFYWNPNSPDKFAKSEIRDAVNGIQTHRIAADGTVLWAYNNQRNEYSTFRYGAYTGAQPQGFRASMLDELTSSSEGPSVFLARLLREIYAGDMAQYRTWFPGARITVVQSSDPDLSKHLIKVPKNATDSFADPVAYRTYQGSETDAYIVYTYNNNRPTRSGAFHFTRNAVADPWNLSEVFYADFQSIKGTGRMIDWSIGISVGNVLESTTFDFMPPKTARVIANVRGQAGG